jgi:hypothetical protein
MTFPPSFFAASMSVAVCPKAEGVPKISNHPKNKPESLRIGKTPFRRLDGLIHPSWIYMAAIPSPSSWAGFRV